MNAKPNINSQTSDKKQQSPDDRNEGGNADQKKSPDERASKAPPGPSPDDKVAPD